MVRVTGGDCVTGRLCGGVVLDLFEVLGELLLVFAGLLELFDDLFELVLLGAGLLELVLFFAGLLELVLFFAGLLELLEVFLGSFFEEEPFFSFVLTCSTTGASSEFSSGEPRSKARGSSVLCMRLSE